MRHGCACVSNDSLQARVQANVLSIDMRLLCHITQCGLLPIDETWLCLCEQRLTVGTGLSQRLINIHAADVGFTQCGLLANDERRMFLCVRKLIAGMGPSQNLINRHAAVVAHYSVRPLGYR
ncbi:hypothetical protein HAX54_052470 [Datura stramonium]|uniref:Uncharacterized protein n=1 Tax=Datura stramonium TaxID=4076 RepID=A0ABS8WSD3_DATST|nr:hypothetical protein [Datura stramonium]